MHTGVQNNNTLIPCGQIQKATELFLHIYFVYKYLYRFYIYLFLKFSATDKYSRAFRPLGILQAQILPSRAVSFFQRVPKIASVRLIWEGPALPGYTAGTTSPHKLLSSSTHQGRGGESTTQYFRYTSPSSLARASIKLNIHGQDCYGLNSVLKDVSRQKGGEVAGPCGIGGGGNS